MTTDDRHSGPAVGGPVTVRSVSSVTAVPAGTLTRMSDVRMSDVEEAPAPRAHARVVYLGPVSPHWEVYGDWGERQVLDDFRARALARLVLLPRDDPQFRRNKERINRDAERELISLEWELGLPGDGE
jgi:hypothetical protein